MSLTIGLLMILTGLAIMAFGLFMAALFYRTRGSVIPTILAHLSWNITLGAGGVQLSSNIFWWTLAGLFALSAVCVEAVTTQ